MGGHCQGRRCRPVATQRPMGMETPAPPAWGARQGAGGEGEAGTAPGCRAQSGAQAAGWRPQRPPTREPGCCGACELFTRAQLSLRGRAGGLPALPARNSIPPRELHAWGHGSAELRRSRRAGGVRGGPSQCQAALGGIRKGWRPQEHPAPPPPPLLQSIPVHWSNSPRGQGMVPATLGSAVPGKPPSEPSAERGSPRWRHRG